MPVVEPYAISEPLSTAGRINMNYQIVPFTYITRNTALQAALRATSVMAIPNTDGSAYKQPLNPHLPIVQALRLYRYNLNIPRHPFLHLDARMTTNKKICSVRLPKFVQSISFPPSLTPDTRRLARRHGGRISIPIGRGYALTGDNTRERPYANLYPLLTTKSNTFTIHYRVQTSATSPSISGYDATKWREGTDQVTGEYRGSQTIERYVGSNLMTVKPIPRFHHRSPSVTQTLAPYYKFRVVSNKQFAP